MDINTIELERVGRSWVRNALTEADLVALDSVCGTFSSAGSRLDRKEDVSGVFGDDGSLTRFARNFLPAAIPVRIIAFSKSSDINWGVPWHQDRVIAVRDRHEVNGFDMWTNKGGTWHVEPPMELLRHMIFARVHLDDTDRQNGCMELALGTHLDGRIRAEDAPQRAQSARIELCEARRGDVLFVKALALHRSRPAQNGMNRRALRIDYCAEALPGPLEWAL